jgi:hypothetical protein
MSISGTGTNISISDNELIANDTCTVTVPPYNGTVENTYTLTLTNTTTDNVARENSKAVFTSLGNTFTFTNKGYTEAGKIIKTINARCAPINGTGYTLTVPIKIKVAGSSTNTQ